MSSSDDAAAASASASASAASASAAAQNAAVAVSNSAVLSTLTNSGVSTNRVFATTAAGLASTVNGNYFYVPSTDANGAFDVWLNNSGTASLITTLPNLTAFLAFLNGSATDAGALTGAETISISRGAGLMQTTLTKFAQWAIQTYKGFTQPFAGAVPQPISVKAANRIDLSDVLPAGTITDYGQYINALIVVANVSSVATVINLPSITMPLLTPISMGRNVILRGGPNCAFAPTGIVGPAIYYRPTGSFNPGRHALENFDIIGDATGALPGWKFPTRSGSD